MTTLLFKYEKTFAIVFVFVQILTGLRFFVAPPPQGKEKSDFIHLLAGNQCCSEIIIN